MVHLPSCSLSCQAYEHMHKAIEARGLVLCEDPGLEVSVLAIWTAAPVEVQEDVALRKGGQSCSADVGRVSLIIVLAKGCHGRWVAR